MVGGEARSEQANAKARRVKGKNLRDMETSLGGAGRAADVKVVTARPRWVGGEMSLVSESFVPELIDA